jgi:hypothetical protein
MTPDAAQPGQEPLAKSSNKVCQKVIAPACEIVPSVSLDGKLNATYYMTYDTKVSYTMNQWCDLNNMTFDWTYQYMD